MWTHQIIDKKLSYGQLNVVVEYTDGEATYTETYQINSLDNLKRTIKNRLASLNELVSLIDLIGLNEIDLTETPTVLTQAQIDQNTFLSDYRQWVNVKKAIDVGLLTGLEAPVVALLAKVKAEFKAAYLALL